MAFSPGTFRYYKDIEEDHEDLSERLRRTLYYGKLPGTDRPSLPLTDLGVNFFQEAAPRQLGKLDHYLAASTSRSACVSPTSMTVGMMYVRRLHRRRPDYLSQISSSELFLISMMMASKFLYDEGIDDEVFNDEWAISGDLETEDVNQMEREFLQAIDWQLFVRPEEFADMLHSIEKRIALQQGIDRGWFSYTDMMILAQDLKFMNWNNLTLELSKVFSAASLAYLAGILTMIGSTMLATTTSTVLMNIGTTTVLPLCLKLAPLMTLYPELSVKVMFGSRSITELPMGSKVIDINRTEIGPLPDMELGELTGEEATDGNNHGYQKSDLTFKPQSDLDPSVKVKLQHKDANSLLNTFLPPFLALVTLKDSLLDYAFGAKQTSIENGATIDIEQNDDLEPQEGRRISDFCSAGPCLMDSWPNCWNISTEEDWNEFKTYTTTCGAEKKPCCDKCVLNANSGLGHGMNMDFLNTDLMDGNVNSDSIKCCCRFSYSETASWMKGSLHSGIIDLNLRFSTQSLYPMFITT